MEITTIVKENRKAFAPLFVLDSATNELALGAIIDETAVGVLGADITEDGILLIRYIFVDPDYRRLKVASELFQRLMLSCEGSGLSYVEARTLDSDDAKELVAFFTAMHLTKSVSTDEVFSCHLGDFAGVLTSSIQVPKEVLPYAAIKAGHWNQLVSLTQVGEDSVMLRERAFYDTQVSSVCMVKNEVTGCVLAHAVDGGYSLDYVCTNGNDPRLMMGMLKRSFSEALKREGEGAVVMVEALNPTSLKLIEKLSSKKAITKGKVLIFGTAL